MRVDNTQVKACIYMVDAPVYTLKVNIVRIWLAELDVVYYNVVSSYTKTLLYRYLCRPIYFLMLGLASPVLSLTKITTKFDMHMHNDMLAVK